MLLLVFKFIAFYFKVAHTCSNQFEPQWRVLFYLRYEKYLVSISLIFIKGSKVEDSRLSFNFLFFAPRKK